MFFATTKCLEKTPASREAAWVLEDGVHGRSEYAKREHGVNVFG